MNNLNSFSLITVSRLQRGESEGARRWALHSFAWRQRRQLGDVAGNSARFVHGQHFSRVGFGARLSGVDHTRGLGRLRPSRHIRRDALGGPGRLKAARHHARSFVHLRSKRFISGNKSPTK